MDSQLVNKYINIAVNKHQSKFGPISGSAYDVNDIKNECWVMILEKGEKFYIDGELSEKLLYRSLQNYIIDLLRQYNTRTKYVTVTDQDLLLNDKRATNSEELEDMKYKQLRNLLFVFSVDKNRYVRKYIFNALDPSKRVKEEYFKEYKSTQTFNNYYIPAGTLRKILKMRSIKQYVDSIREPLKEFLVENGYNKSDFMLMSRKVKK